MDSYGFTIIVRRQGLLLGDHAGHSTNTPDWPLDNNSQGWYFLGVEYIPS